MPLGEPSVAASVVDGPPREPPGDVRPPSAYVEVAVDAPGIGSRTYTYHVPASLGDLQAGEAVLIEFGRRQALGIVLGLIDVESAAGMATEGATKPVLARVRADGPLLPSLSLSLARWIASHYLAPPAMVLRAMLPPGLLERLDLVAEAVPSAASTTDGGMLPTADLPRFGPGFGGGPVAGEGWLTPEDALAAADRELLDELRREPRPVRDLAAADGRAALLRRLHDLERRGLVRLEWTLTAATGGPRYERWVILEPAGREAALAVTAGGQPRGLRLGHRQVAALAELLGAPDSTLAGSVLADHHGSAVTATLERRGFVRSELRERPRVPLAARARGRRGTRPEGSVLTERQQAGVRLVETAIAARDSRPLLLDGVTGGGKTAIYVEAIERSLIAGRPVVVLVPEIALALPLVDRLRAELDAGLALLHSGLGEGERADEWRRIRSGAVDIVVGTRLAVLAPLADVGLVIVDEEHDPAYKSDRTPRLQARDTAIRLASLAGAAVILGSATPAVETVGKARSGEYATIRLPERPVGAPPRIEIVDLRAELAAGNRSLLSRSLASALASLDAGAGDRAILVMNRRGSASVVMCRDCGHVQACPECGRPLVFHQAGITLRCHQCGTASPLARRCPNCRSPRIRYLGGGTERIESEVRSAFPALRVGRLDRDVAERRGAATRVVDAFTDGRLDVLVGTSLVTKGLDIPQVTLVGVVSADVALNLPDERAAERTYQLLVQAVGRAGRGESPGRAIVQTYQPEHPAIRAVATGDGEHFYEAELELRRRFGSPPYGSLVKLTVALPDQGDAERTAVDMADLLRERASERGANVSVVGPAPAYMLRRAGRWRWNVILRGNQPAALLDGGLSAPWSVDVDPESLL